MAKDKDMVDYITQIAEKIDPEISVVVAQRNTITVPFCATCIGLSGQWGEMSRSGETFKLERIALEHKMPGGLLGYGEQSRTLAIKWDE